MMRRRGKKEEPMAMRDWPEPAWTPALDHDASTQDVASFDDCWKRQRPQE